jgi:TolB-like protein
MNAMQFTDRDSTSSSIAEIQAARELILNSESFCKSPRMRRLLGFLIDKLVSGDLREMGEYAIGMEVFDRKAADYNTSEDPIARVQIGRLRERLKTYYASLPSPSEIEISIPLGSYVPVIRRQKWTDAAGATQSRLSVYEIKCIAHSTNGLHFTQGLQEELVHQLFRVLGGGITVHAIVALETESLEPPRSANTATSHRLEGSVRIDDERIRTSVRLVNVSRGNVTWSSQFDRNIFFAITQQEELARSICTELKHFLSPATAFK